MSDLSNPTAKFFLTPAEVAERLGVSPVTVRYWARQGLLRAGVTPGGHRRFALGEVERFALARRARPDPAGGALRVLVVDDDRPLVRYLSERLSRLPGVEVEGAFNGFDAGRKLYSFRPDLVLLDLMMPGLDGFEVCRTLKAHPSTRDIRVIAMTGYPSPENLARIRETGAEHCLAKPFETAELLEALGIREPAGAAP